MDDGPIGVNMLSDLEYFGRVSTGVVEVRILRIHCFLVSPAGIWSSHPYSLSKTETHNCQPWKDVCDFFSSKSATL